MVSESCAETMVFMNHSNGYKLQLFQNNQGVSSILRYSCPSIHSLSTERTFFFSFSINCFINCQTDKSFVSLLHLTRKLIIHTALDPSQFFTLLFDQLFVLKMLKFCNYVPGSFLADTVYVVKGDFVHCV